MGPNAMMKRMLGIVVFGSTSAALAQDQLGYVGHYQQHGSWLAQIFVSTDLVSVSFDCPVSLDTDACRTAPAVYFSPTEIQMLDALLQARARDKAVTVWTDPSKPLLTLFSSDTSPGLRDGSP
jgi:hypothetical protein